MRSRHVYAAIGLALLLPFAWLVWPTPYRYHHSDNIAFREHRVTGRVDYLTYEGWRHSRADARRDSITKLPRVCQDMILRGIPSRNPFDSIGCGVRR